MHTPTYKGTTGPEFAGGSARSRIRRRVVLLVLLWLSMTGCTFQETDTVTRTGTKELGAGDEPGFIGGKSVTLVPPAERKLAAIPSGPALSGKGTVSTADYAGKVIAINVWGSWCGPCRLEAPDLAAASKEAPDVAAFVGINIRDYQPDAPRAFVRAFDIPYPHIFDPNGEQLIRFAGTLPPNGIPTTLVIDKQGRIAPRVVGVISKSTLVTLIRDTDQGR